MTIVMPVVWPSFNGDGTGPYEVLIKEILDDSGQTYELVYFPLPRAINSFNANKDSCYPVANKDIAEHFLGRPFADAGEPLNKTRTVLATLKTNAKINSVDALNGKSIVTLRGEELSAYGLDSKNLIVTYVDRHEQSVKMLSAERANVVLGISTDLYVYRDTLHWNESLSLFDVEETFTCHLSNRESPAFLKAVGQSIRKLRDSGRIKELLGDLYTLD